MGENGDPCSRWGTRKCGEDHLVVLILFQIDNEKLYSQEAEGLVETIGRQAGIAIQNARLFDRERRRADEFEALRTALTEMSSELELPRLFNSILRRAIQLMLASAGELGPAADDRAHYQVVSRENIQDARSKAELSLGEDLLGKVLLSRQALVMNDYSNWEERSLSLENGLPVAALGVPMIANGKLLGAIIVV